MSSKPAILLVDDEPDLLFSLIGLLRRDFEVHTAETGAEALKILAQHEIDVLMTDQRMPEMTGAELTQEVCRKYPDTTRILFTGYADIKSVIEAINHGGLYRYITKPWDPDELVALLHVAAIEHKKAVSEKTLLEAAKQFVLHGRRIADHLLLNENSGSLDRSVVEPFVHSVDRVESLLAETSPSDPGVPE